MSETRSDTPQRKNDCVLLLDENICSISIADTLRLAPGWTIELHSSHFNPGTDDAVIAKYCGERGWALVTCDDMRYTPETKEAIAKYNVRVLKVVVKKSGTLGVDMAASLVLAREQIIAFLKRNRSAVVAHIHKSGHLAVMARFNETAKPLTEAQKRTAQKYGGRLF